MEPERIKQQTMVADVEWFATLPSTNDHAVQQARNRDCRKPLLVLAEQQTAGRGRGANQWWSEQGALTFALLIDSIQDVPNAFISLAMGVAVCDAIRSFDGALDAGLKWPNDVYLADRKAGGILIERPSMNNGDCIIGIGLNVNNSTRSAPAEILDKATSLLDMGQQEYELQAVLIHLLQHIERALGAIGDDLDKLRGRWRELCILRGRQLEVDLGDRSHIGMCQGIDDDGALVIETASGPARCTTGVVKSFE